MFLDVCLIGKFVYLSQEPTVAIDPLLFNHLKASKIPSPKFASVRGHNPITAPVLDNKIFSLAFL